MTNHTNNTSIKSFFSRKQLLFTLLCLFLSQLLGCQSATKTTETIDWTKRRKALGHKDKYRILVDKVLSKSNRWIMSEENMDEIKKAGFNVVVPRQGGDDIERVKRVADMARKRGMFYMPWMRGTLAAKTGTKLTWDNGGTQDMYSPNSDELWDWMTDLILAHARLSAENPAIIGSFLDFENYYKNSQGNCYELSYDEKIISEFAKAKKLDLPDLKSDQHKPWLEKNNLLEAFSRFQINSWRMRCRKLRKQIDAINPNFQLTIYPQDTLFLDKAIYPEWGTANAPLIIADPWTYGRRQVPHAEALELNKDILLKGMKKQGIKAKTTPILYIGGIDPMVSGADAEFSGSNASMLSEISNGYWIFYEGPRYRTTHPDYFKWFTLANKDIIAHKYALWKQPRQESDPVTAARNKILKKYCGDTVSKFSKEPMPKGAERAACTTRGKASFIVLLQAGETLTGRLKLNQLSNYIADARYSLFCPDRHMVAKGIADFDKPTQLNYVAKKTGVHVIYVESGLNTANLAIDNQYFCMVATRRTSLLGRQPTLYFLTEHDTKNTSVTIGTSPPGETAVLTITDSTGQVLAKGDTMENSRYKAEFTLTNQQPLSLALSRASIGSLDDVKLTLGKGCAKLLITHPSRLLFPKNNH